MNPWPLINVVCGGIVALILIYKLVMKPASFTLTERVGMGMIGGGMVLTFGPLMSTAPTPFEDWSGTVLRIGCAVYFTGRILKHWQNNAAQKRIARAHMKARSG